MQKDLQEVVKEYGCSLDTTYIDVPRLRMVTSDGSVCLGGRVLAKSPNMRGLTLRIASVSGPSPLRTIARAASFERRMRPQMSISHDAVSQPW